jgi:hypothetical protein
MHGVREAAAGGGRDSGSGRKGHIPIPPPVPLVPRHESVPLLF